MDTESCSAIRDAFLFDVHRQFEGLSRWVPPPLTTAVWEDGREAVFSVSNEAGEWIRFTLVCDIGDGGELTARLIVEQHAPHHQIAEPIILRWHGSLPEPGKGLDSRADVIDGEDAKEAGQVVRFLHERLADMLQSQRDASARLPAVRAESRPVALKRVQERPAIAVRDSANGAAAGPAEPKEAAPAGTPDLESLVSILRGLPHAEGLDVEHIFGGFIAAVNRVTPLREGEIAGFVGEALGELQAYQEAYLGARSPMTGLGLGLKGAALIGAFLVSMGVETWTGMKGFGPLFGDWGAAIPSAFGSCVIGGGLMPIAETPKEVRGVRNVAIFWSCILSMAVATGDTPRSIQHRLPQGQVLLDARAEAVRLRAEKVLVTSRLAAARGEKAATGLAYVNAKRNRLAVFNSAAGNVKSLEAEEKSATTAVSTAENKEARALETDRSLYLAQAVVFLFAATLNSVGPFFIGKYFSKVAGDHEAGLKRARKNRFIRAKARLFGSESGQRQKARVMLSALESYYANELHRRGMACDEIERRVKSAFGNAGKIVNGAVGEFRQALRPARARLLALMPGRRSLE
ncbi:MAG: hypothetical protein ACLPWS_20600 [Rhodomicrobium sp.]